MDHPGGSGGCTRLGRPDQKFVVWARIKFEGRRFPHAKPGDKDAIYLERLVLVKAD
jgi:hypothetical protein